MIWVHHRRSWIIFNYSTDLWSRLELFLNWIRTFFVFLTCWPIQQRSNQSECVLTELSVPLSCLFPKESCCEQQFVIKGVDADRCTAEVLRFLLIYRFRASECILTLLLLLLVFNCHVKQTPPSFCSKGVPSTDVKRVLRVAPWPLTSAGHEWTAVGLTVRSGLKQSPDLTVRPSGPFSRSSLSPH